MIVKLHEKEIDLSKAVPLKVGDWRALGRMGVNTQLMKVENWDNWSKYVFYVLHKADPTVKEEDIDNLDANDPVFWDVIKFTGGKKEENPS